MDSDIVSAFSIYNTNKKQKSKKKTKNARSNVKATNIVKTVNEDTIKKINKKLKQKHHTNKHLKPNNKKNRKKVKKNHVNITSNSKVPENENDASGQSDLIILKPLANNDGHALSYSTNGQTFSDASSNSFDFTPITTDSKERGLKAFKWLIAPYNSDTFFKKIWEKKPLHISRKTHSYYKELISTPIIDNILRNENVLYTTNIDITSYMNEVRETHNSVGRALPHVVWDYYLNDCSIRLTNPQIFIPKIHLLNYTLQECFNCFVGANAYLTPPDSQGFAPHYDDIEAFILQIEGKKHWRVYKPRTENEILPRVSSKNFSQDEIGEPILEVTLEPGDLLYFPRGFIHQAVTVPKEHSLHLTISMYQQNSYADLFEKMIPQALQAAINENVELRRGLPLDIYDNLGLVHSDAKTQRRKEIQRVIKSLFDKIKDHLPGFMDTAVDEMNKKYQHEALPPILSDAEKAVTVYGDSDVMVENGKVTRRVEIEPDTKIRLIRKNILHMAKEENGITLYYHMDNSLVYKELDLQCLQISDELARAVKILIDTYPKYISVENLDVEDEAEKVQVAKDLWERGLLMTEYPLEYIDDD